MKVGDVKIRQAQPEDVADIVALLADDDLGRQREDPTEPLAQSYRDAFEAIARDPNNLLVVAEEHGGQLVATLQLTFLPSLSYRGSWRAQIEAVRVSSALRGQGIGRTLVTWAIEEAQRRGCEMAQLTSNRARGDAHRFYASLGFVATHAGMKLHLRDADDVAAVPADAL